MIKMDVNVICDTLVGNGYIHDKFDLVSEGRFSVEDADWNYKDIPHLKMVHKLIDNNIVYGTDKFLASIAFQRLFGIFKLPLCLINYDYNKDSQVYYTSFLFFILLIQTKYIQINENYSRVITTYNIFSPKLLSFLFPIIKIILKRNFSFLMADDIPMRLRRGELRGKGYLFKKRDPDGKYSYLETTELMRENVVQPDSVKSQQYTFELDKESNDFFATFNGVNVYRIVKYDSSVRIYEAVCLHEGADLSRAKLDGSNLICPWHGKRIAPLVSLDEKNSLVVRKDRRFKLSENKLTID
jgi:hypothetical protein